MSENNKLKLLRVLDIMKRTDEFHPINAKQIVDKLKFYGIDVERKSILRDLKCLEDAGYSINKCENHNDGFYMTDQLFEDYELKILADAVNSSKFLTQKDSHEIVKKLKSIATYEGEEIIHATTYVDNEIKSDDSMNKIKIDTIIRAIKGNKKISFQYYENDKNGKKKLKRDGYTYRISPYYLVLYYDEYILIGNSETNNHATYFRVEMITKIEAINEIARRKEEIEEFGQNDGNFKIAKYLKQNVNLWPGEIKEVKLLCNNSIMNHVKKKFGKDIWMKMLENGTFETRVAVADSKGFYEWLGSYGTKAVLLSPDDMIDHYRSYLLEILGKYKV